MSKRNSGPGRERHARQVRGALGTHRGPGEPPGTRKVALIVDPETADAEEAVSRGNVSGTRQT